MQPGADLYARARAAVGRAYHSARRAYLRRRFPDGGLLRCNGVDVFCDFAMPVYRWYDGPSPNLELDQRVLDILFARAEGDVFVDVGAHWGFFVAYAARSAQAHGSPTRIIALEPDSANVRCLHRTVEAGPAGDVVILPLAVTERDRPVTLYEGYGDCLHCYATLAARPRGEVPGVCLDSVKREYIGARRRIGVIKIDVDGAEPLVLAGGRRVLSEDRPFILMEFAPTALERFGVDPKIFFRELCERFSVHWLRYRELRLLPVGPEDYQNLADEVGGAITDLVLTGGGPLPEIALDR